MITIFNGRRRGLGQTDTSEVYLQVTITLRRHLQQFRGAKFAVFMAVALHSDEQGWARPSISLLEQETGYNKNTISQAIQELCCLEIEGHRVLLAFQGRHGNRADVNRYLLFPTDAEVEEYEGQPGPFRRVDPAAEAGKDKRGRDDRNSSPLPTAADGLLHTGKQYAEKQYTGKQDTAKLHTANPDVSITIGKKNHSEEEPGGRRTTPPHTGAADAAVSVCMKSKFSLKQCLRYAEHLQRNSTRIYNPGGLAKSFYDTGSHDELIAEFLNPPPRPAATLDTTKCPDCKGSGWWYPKGPERGVAKCKHTRLQEEVYSRNTNGEQQSGAPPPPP